MRKPPSQSRTCRPSKRLTGGCQPKDVDDRPNSLPAVVAHYKAHCQKRAAAGYQFYASRPSLEDVVKIAAFAENPDGKRDGHQYRLTKEALKKAYRRLQEADLRTCTTFHQLFTEIEDRIGQITGIGPLMVYDTALRIGAFLGLEPEKVYLHRGARDGAKAIGLGKGKDTLEVSELPGPFHRLRPREIEDCLCIYKKELKVIHGT